MPRFSERNIEDWDFRHAGPDAWDTPEYDVEADLFFSTKHVHIVAIEGIRTHMISVLAREDYAHPLPDGEHFELTEDGVRTLRLAGRRLLSFSYEDRITRKVARSLVREWQKYGRIRANRMPARERD